MDQAKKAVVAEVPAAEEVLADLWAKVEVKDWAVVKAAIRAEVWVEVPAAEVVPAVFREEAQAEVTEVKRSRLCDLICSNAVRRNMVLLPNRFRFKI